jgi:hypothetical protein
MMWLYVGFVAVVCAAVPETGRPLKHVPLRDLVEREKARLEPTEET